ncbi:hypothetical protein ICE98_00618 [Lactococcus lactis]|nr:hypothetical protein [Lactococcus lactis]
MLQNVENAGIKVDKNLKELLGHTPIQVMGGTILGIIVATNNELKRKTQS